jgi:1,4-alpha-glucan branching enzyme
VNRKISEEDIYKIVEARHNAPHTVLGPHYIKEEKTMIIRVFSPHAHEIYIRKKGPMQQQVKMKKIHPDGLFEAYLPKAAENLKYQLVYVFKDGKSDTIHDPYAFVSPSFSEFDRYLFFEGKHIRLFDKLGAQVASREKIKGVLFTVWAPNAQRVSVVGQFNRWDGRCHPMVFQQESGLWELFIPGLKEDAVYKYEIKSPTGDVFTRNDPLATTATLQNECIVSSSDIRYKWQDDVWMTKVRFNKNWETAIIFKFNSFDWANIVGDGNLPLTFKTMSEKLIPFISARGFKYLEISPFSGQKITSFFAPNPHYGSHDDLRAFIDQCHLRGIGVILKCVSSFFTEALEEMSWFDGTRLYDFFDMELNASRLNIYKHEIKCYVLSNALYWLEKFHFDGLSADLPIFQILMEQTIAQNEAFKHVKLFCNELIGRSTYNDSDIHRLIHSRHDYPHGVLGAHYLYDNVQVVRAFKPEAADLYVMGLKHDNILCKMRKIHDAGLFEAIVYAGAETFQYKLYIIDHQGAHRILYDSYLFRSSFFGDLDRHLFSQGNHYDLYTKLGSHLIEYDGVSGINFGVWAPNAERVSVVGLFNKWDGRPHMMRRLEGTGIWEIFIPGLGEGEIYKYEIRSQKGDTFLKTDPYAFRTEIPPETAAMTYDIDHCYEWQDHEWMSKRSEKNTEAQPISIYEVHLGSWKKKANNQYLTYKELADMLIPYVKDLGCTYIELLPIAEHPYAPSWGYQVSNYFAPTSRFGKPCDLMELIDRCHQEGIGVILDWVPAHFPKDAPFLAWFDGTCIYEHPDPRRGEHKEWGTLVFNYGRPEVDNFLISNALFWLKQYHFDGLRVDAVASMLYLDYSRGDNWLPNKYGGREHLEAIEFLKHVNSIVRKQIPGALMIAEESTAWPKVSRLPEEGGLGFDFKWNMGWMHDILLYMGKDPVHRSYHHNNLTFGLVYAFSENFILSLSHDEVVHLKKSLLDKMPGDESQKFANLRLLFTFMYAHPGKKLLFMGAEFGQWHEWDHETQLEWFLLDKEQHQMMKAFFRDLNHIYRSEKPFYEVDFKNNGFEWIDAQNATSNVIAFARKAKDPRHALFFVMNFSSITHYDYRLGVPFPGYYEILLNSDDEKYWGKGLLFEDEGIIADEIQSHNHLYSLNLTLPALSAIVFKPSPPAGYQLIDESKPIKETIVIEVKPEPKEGIQDETIEEIELEEPIATEPEETIVEQYRKPRRRHIVAPALKMKKGKKIVNRSMRGKK